MGERELTEWNRTDQIMLRSYDVLYFTWSDVGSVLTIGDVGVTSARTFLPYMHPNDAASVARRPEF